MQIPEIFGIKGTVASLQDRWGLNIQTASECKANSLHRQRQWFVTQNAYRFWLQLNMVRVVVLPSFSLKYGITMSILWGLLKWATSDSQKL